MNVTLGRRAAMLACALMIGACASFAMRNPPRVEVASIALDRVEGANAYFIIDLALTNSADQEIAIDTVTGGLSIEGEKVAEASLVHGPVRLSPHGTAHAGLTARTGMDAILGAVATAMRRAAGLGTPGVSPALRYTLDATATVAGGGRFTFSCSGEIGERKP